jgi:hypothetical protein
MCDFFWLPLSLVMRSLLFCIILSVAGCTSSSSNAPVPLNAYSASIGRQEMIRKGAPRLKLGMSQEQVKKIVGWPDIEEPTRWPTSLHLSHILGFPFPRGKRVGTEWEYWLQYNCNDNFEHLKLYFDLKGSLSGWDGRLSAKRFEKPAITRGG